MMRRREFIALLGGTVLPLSTLAQQTGITVVGFLSSRSPSESSNSTVAFRQGLSEVGFVEGQNLVIAFRWAEGRYDRLGALASDLVQLRVALILAAGGPPPVIAAKAVTSTIPIVFSGVTDPVRVGLVASLGRPGGTVTGIGLFNNSLLAKRLELLHELVPTAAAIGMLVNPLTQWRRRTS